MPHALTFVIVYLLSLGACSGLRAEGAQATYHALLVGCTVYDQLPQKHHLIGPANDVALMRDLLERDFGFPPRNITSLVENYGEEMRPLRENVRREFVRLANPEIVKAGDHVVIFLAGHGTQQPDDDPNNPEDPEPDGMDEVFCCADVKSITAADHGNVIPGGICDDTLRDWIQPIQSNGARLWIIVDSCCSGTIIRGPEVVRAIAADELLSKEALAAAVPKDRGRGTSYGDNVWFNEPSKLDNVAAMYAAQSDEPTVEKRQPRGESDAAWHGLFTYTLVKAIRESKTRLTYQELTERIHSAYVRDRRRGPTPLVEGADRHHEVLSRKSWPDRSAFLLKGGPGNWKINAGSLHGLTRGTRFSVYPPLEEQPAGAENPPLGFIKVGKLGLIECDVEPVASAAEVEPVASAAELETATEFSVDCRCELEFVDYGDPSLRVAVFPDSDDQLQLASQRIREWRETLDRLAKEQGAVIRHVQDPQEADWILRPWKQGELILSPASGWAEVPGSMTFGPVEDGQDLKRKLGQIARAQNLLAVTAELRQQRWRGWPATVASDEKVDIRFMRFSGPHDPDGKQLDWKESIPSLKPGEILGVEVDNPTASSVYVNLVFVDSGYGISVLFPPADRMTDNQLRPDKTFRLPFEIQGDTTGPEHLVAIVLDQPVDLSWLEQSTLKKARAIAKARGGEQNLNTPLSLLLQNACYNRGTTRGLGLKAAANITSSVASWETVAD